MTVTDQRARYQRAAKASAAVRRQAVIARIQAGTKTCGKCREDLPFTAFSPARNRPDRLAGWCRSCVAEGQRARVKVTVRARVATAKSTAGPRRGARQAVALAAGIATRQARVTARVQSGVKPCARCHVVKPYTEYSPSRDAADRHHAYCRSCAAAYVREIRERKTRADWVTCTACLEAKPPAEYVARNNPGRLSKNCATCRAAAQARKRFLATLGPEQRAEFLDDERDAREEAEFARSHPELPGRWYRHVPVARITDSEFPCCLGEEDVTGKRLHSRSCAVRIPA